MSRWLVTGAGGMLGRDLCDLLGADPTIDLRATTRAEFDIRDAGQADAAVAGADIVINAAAWTDVDGAEAAEAEATAINGSAVQTLANACARRNTRLIQLSTDYVFDGMGTLPYPEIPSNCEPVNAYGRGKLLGEQAVLATLQSSGYVVRTAWLYGAHGRNFVATVLRRAQTHAKLEVVDDQVGQPTWTVCLARQLIALGKAALAGHAPGGIYHGVATGSATWFELARAAFAEAGLDPDRIAPTTSAAFPRPARRPSRSVLGQYAWAKIDVSPQPHWREQLTEAFHAGVFVDVLA